MSGDLTDPPATALAAEVRRLLGQCAPVIAAHSERERFWAGLATGGFIAPPASDYRSPTLLASKAALDEIRRQRDEQSPTDSNTKRPADSAMRISQRTMDGLLHALRKQQQSDNQQRQTARASHDSS